VSAAEEILDQMAYLVDELEAQQAVLSLIPAPVWDARPPTDPQTLGEMYAGMLGRECDANRVALGLSPTELPTWETHHELLAAIAKQRAANVAELKAGGLPGGFEQAGWAITQQDTDSLRDVGVRLNETSLGPPRVKQG
jgi:hypothetical protein